MKQELITALETICPGNVFLQGTIPESQTYPDSFITFWTNSSSDDAFMDDEETRVVWSYGVFYYSNDPATIPVKAAAIRSALKAAGFIPQGRGYDIPSDVETHTGWAMEFIIAENL